MKKIFTEEEDEKIFEALNGNSSNIHAQFNRLSMSMKKTPAQIRDRWYSKIRYGKDAFAIASGGVNYRNTKNVWSKKPRPDMVISKSRVKKIIMNVSW